MDGPFCWKKMKQSWFSIPICIFGVIWKERNKIVNVQKLRHSFFVYNIWEWNRLYLGKDCPSLLGFLGCLASEGKGDSPTTVCFLVVSFLWFTSYGLFSSLHSPFFFINETAFEKDTARGSSRIPNIQVLDIFLPLCE